MKGADTGGGQEEDEAATPAAVDSLGADASRGTADPPPAFLPLPSNAFVVVPSAACRGGEGGAGALESWKSCDFSDAGAESPLNTTADAITRGSGSINCSKDCGSGTLSGWRMLDIHLLLMTSLNFT